LYLFSPLPPQRNGLADYIVEYLDLLAKDFDLWLVAENGSARAVAAHFAGRAFAVIDEACFAARMPETGAQMLYNLGNNQDCIYMLDYLHRFPGAVLLHDVSLFYLHQITFQQNRAHAMMGDLLVAEGYKLPDYCLHPDGSLARTPGLLYQECLMVRQVVHSAKGLVVHSRYAERRVRGGAPDVALGIEHGHPFARIPHFVSGAPTTAAPEKDTQVLARFGVRPADFVLLCPGFLTGNKMLYEVLVAHRNQSGALAGLKLIFGGEERPDEYPISEKIAQLWPAGDGPVVTGYLSAEELDVLLARADLSFVLRYPTYGETSGILPRAVMGGGQVVTVDIGSYPEFESPLIRMVQAGPGTVSALEQCIRQAYLARDEGPPRAQRRAVEVQRARALTPAALYPQFKSLLLQAQEISG
jgi:hypothetical protein